MLVTYPRHGNLAQKTTELMNEAASHLYLGHLTDPETNNRCDPIGLTTVENEELLTILVDQSLSPLGDDGVGNDLASSRDTVLTQIRDEFSNSSRDFNRLFDLGRQILTEQSKDLWAVWSLVGGMLWSGRFAPDEALVASSRICTGVCKTYWKRLYPESTGLRNTLVGNVAKWWNTLLVKHGNDIAPDTLRQSAREIQSLTAFLVRQYGADENEAVKKFPVISALTYVSEAMIAHSSKPRPSSAQNVSVPPTADDETGTISENRSAPISDWWETENVEEFDDETATIVAHKTEPPPQNESLGESFQQCSQAIKSGQVQQSLDRFEQILAKQTRLSQQIRGQMLLGELYLQAKMPDRARRLLDYTHQQLKHVRIYDWDPELCQRLWSLLLQSLQTGDRQVAHDPLLAELSVLLQRVQSATSSETSRQPPF